MTNPTGLPMVSDAEFNEEQRKSDAAFDQEFGDDRPGVDTVAVGIEGDTYAITGTPEEIEVAIDHITESDSLPDLFNL